jgi:hypothetical protein
MQASIPMDADDMTAVFAGPADVLLFDELPDPPLLYVVQVIQHAHPVSRVSLVQSLQPGAGVLGASVAVLANEVLAVLDPAVDAMLGLPGIVSPAARTSVFLPQVGNAEPAVHTAGSDQVGG